MIAIGRADRPSLPAMVGSVCIPFIPELSRFPAMSCVAAVSCIGIVMDAVSCIRIDVLSRMRTALVSCTGTVSRPGIDCMSCIGITPDSAFAAGAATVSRAVPLGFRAVSGVGFAAPPADFRPGFLGPALGVALRLALLSPMGMFMGILCAFALRVESAREESAECWWACA
jgi:hypothetical protein